MLKAEDARLDRMRKKQEREMAAIVEFETNLVKKKVEAEEKIKKDMERLALRNAEHRERERKLIIKKREVQLARKQMADEERERLRDRLKDEFHQEKEEAAAIAAEKEAVEIERRRRCVRACVRGWVRAAQQQRVFHTARCDAAPFDRARDDDDARGAGSQHSSCSHCVFQFLLLMMSSLLLLMLLLMLMMMLMLMLMLMSDVVTRPPHHVHA